MCAAIAQEREAKIFRPQPGQQEEFSSCGADIVFFGGSAGGGKTFAELLEQIRHIGNPRFIGVIFRKEAAQINDPGGLLDASKQIYPYLGGDYQSGLRMWEFPSGAKVAFRHINEDRNLEKYQGAEIALIEFDELTHFSERAFFYMMSRNRSTCGIRPYMRAVMNPDPDSWIRTFIDWWVDDKGFIDSEKSGRIRFFARVDGEVHWADSRKELYRKFFGLYRMYKRTGVHQVKSFTFIKSSIWDNKALMAVNPEYLSNLLSLPLIDRMALLEGNWDTRATAGLVFNQRWFDIIEPDELPFDPSRPGKGLLLVRGWDFAGTEAELFGSKTTKNEPCWTVGLKMAYYAPWKAYFVLHVVRMRIGPAKLDDEVLKWCRFDGRHVPCRWEQEPGSSGIRDTWRLKTHLKGFDTDGLDPEGDKLTRAKPMSSAAEKQKIILVNAPWLDIFTSELHSFPEGRFKDQVDAATLSYNYLYDMVQRGFGIAAPMVGSGSTHG